MYTTFEIKNHVGYITLNRPEVLNALNRQLKREFLSLLCDIEKDQNLRVIVLTGRGRAFCAGSDINDLRSIPSAEAEELMRTTRKLCGQLEQLPQPTIAAVNGYALGGGCGLVLAADIKVASETAMLGFPEIKLGWNAPFGMAHFARVVGITKARELFLTGRMIDAHEALQIGLVNFVTQPGELMETVEKLALQVAEYPPTAVRAIKKIFTRTHKAGYDEEEEMREFVRCFEAEDAQKAIRKFLDK